MTTENLRELELIPVADRRHNLFYSCHRSYHDYLQLAITEDFLLQLKGTCRYIRCVGDIA